MKTNQQIIEAIKKTIFLTPESASEKQCFAHAAPTADELSRPCIASECMNWVDLGKVGFCVRACTNKVMDSVFGFGSSDANH